MIDALPVGYISLDQAVTRLAANISDRDYQEEMRRFREHMRHLDHIRVEVQKAGETGPTGQSQNEAETENRQSEEPENPDPARLLWGKRELAIAKLHAALCDGRLLALVREPSGQIFQLTTSDFRGAVFWRDIILSGCVRAAGCEEIERHDGRRVLIDESALSAWLKKMTEHKPAVFDDDCQAWLEREMRASPQRTRPKAYWRARAMEKFGVSARAFDRMWPNAIKNTGAHWDRAGAPSKVLRNPSQ